MGEDERICIIAGRGREKDIYVIEGDIRRKGQ
jgi:hypothetical protein